MASTPSEIDPLTKESAHIARVDRQQLRLLRTRTRRARKGMGEAVHPELLRSRRVAGQDQSSRHRLQVPVDAVLDAGPRVPDLSVA